MGVASAALYGGSHNLLGYTLPRFDIETTFVDPRDPQAFADAIQDNTRLVFGETLGNPSLDVLNIPAIAEATAGYSGAELAALTNEAAIRAVRRSSSELTQRGFLDAIATFNLARRRLPSVESFIPSELKKQQWWPGSAGSGDGGASAA